MILNPKIDLVFKKLFGSEENKDILMSLINAILPPHQQVADITLKNPYNFADYIEGKLSVLDIKAESVDGRLFDIEMQIKSNKFYGKRVLFYWAKMYGSQLDYIDEIPTADKQLAEMERLAQLEREGKLGYSGLKKCIVISLMDFNFFNDERYRRYFTLKDGDTNETNPDLDYLDLYFVELRKFNGNLTGVRTTLERWITFLNNAYKFQEQQLPQELAEIREIQKANLRLKAMYLDRQERMYYDSQQKFWLDQISYVAETISKAREEGREEGLKEGREEGLKEGIKEGKFLIAKNLIKLGFDDETIMKATGLSNIEIEQIRKNMS